MEPNYFEFSEMAREARREIEKTRESYVEKVSLMDGYLQLLEAADTMHGENDRMREENSILREKLAEEKRQREELEMKLAEMSKLSVGVAKKTSEEALLKALRTYANTSKRKTADKRTFAKTAILDMANVNGLDLPEELKATIESLDDEQPDAKVVNVAGNYNDVHDNEAVKLKA